MAGRGRRAAPEGGPARTFVKETDFLKPQTDTSDAAMESWPEFRITQYVVTRADGSALANPLLKEYEGRCIIRGRVEVDGDNRDWLRDPSGPQTGNLEIEVSAYSVGWEEVARVWLAGVCGWYILGEPAEEYRPVWIDLIRATTLFYKFSNIHAEAMKNRRATGDVRINKLFFKYALAMGDGVFRKEIVQRCSANAEFLIAHMTSKGNEPVDGIRWPDTPFYAWLCRSFPAVVDRLTKARQAVGGKVPPPRLQSPTQIFGSDGEESSSAEASEGEDDKGRTVAGRASAGLRSSTPVAAKTESPAPAHPRQQRALSLQQVVRDDPMDVRKSDEVVSKIADILTTIIHTALEEECRRRRMKSFTNMLFFDWRFPKPAYTKIKDVLPHYSRQIIERLDPKWRDTRVYCELEAEAAKPPRPLEPLTDQDILKFLVPRKKLYQETQSVPKKKPERKQSPSETATGGQGSKVGEKRPRSRPRTAGKTATLRPAAPVAERAAESDESEDEDSWLEEYRQGPPAKKSALEGPHNASSSPARRLQDDDDASDADSSSDSSSIVDLGIDDNDPDLADAVGDPGSTASVSTMRLVVRAERLPNTEPQGPNGTWVCEYCGHVVRDAARDRRQQELVRQHLRDHEDQEEKISLAVSEGMAGGVNVSHLLDRIRQAGEKSRAKNEVKINGKTAPEPIKKRMLV